jgi:hypothetical protein
MSAAASWDGRRDDPVFLLLTALVVDVGNWFTHSRCRTAPTP